MSTESYMALGHRPLLGVIHSHPVSVRNLGCREQLNGKSICIRKKDFMTASGAITTVVCGLVAACDYNLAIVGLVSIIEEMKKNLPTKTRWRKQSRVGWRDDDGIIRPELIWRTLQHRQAREKDGQICI